MKKFLTSLLCVMMITCFMPTMAWAEEATDCSGGTDCGHVASITTTTEDGTETTTHYDTVAEAVAAVADNTETKITLLKDTKEDVIISENQEIVLDLGEHTITAKNLAYTIISSGTLTIEGQNGKVVAYSSKYQSLLVKNGETTIESGEFSGGLIGAVVTANGTLNVNGGKITGASVGIKTQIGGTTNISGGDISGTYYGVLCLNLAGYDAEETQIKIFGGEIKGAYGVWAQGVKDAKASITVNGDDADITGTSLGGYCLYAGAEINVSKGSLQGKSGIQAQSGGTVKVTGGTVTGTTGAGIVCYNPLTTSTEETKVDISGGTVAGNQGVSIIANTTPKTDSDSTARTEAKATVNIGGTALVQGTTNPDNTPVGVYLAGSGAVLNVSGGTVEGHAYGISGNGSKNSSVDNGDTVINITGGIIEQTGSVSGGAIYHPQNGKLNISGNPEITGENGIQLCSGEGVIANITGGSVVATGADKREGKTGDGFIPDGAALSIVDRSYPGGTPKMNVSGGTFTSKQSEAVLAYTWSDNRASEWEAANQYLQITGGKFSSNPKAYVAPNATIYLNKNGFYQVNNDAHTGIYNIWTVNNDGIYEESYYSTPTTPTTTQPVTSVTPGTEDGKETVTTSTSISATVSDTGVVEQEVDKDLADQIVASAVENKATEVVIEVTSTKGNATSTSVSLPAETIKTIAENTTANVTIKTDAAEITLDQKTTETIAKEAKGENIQLVVEKTKDEEGEMHFDLKITSDNKTIGNFQGGNVTVKVALNETLAAKENLTSVYINDAGKYTKMGGQKNEDGTFSFNTGHFSTYAIMEEAEADAVIADQTAEANAKIKAGVKATTVTATAKATKGAITLTWTKSKGYRVDAYQVYRSTKKSGGYKLLTTTKKTTVKNTKGLKKGTRYYYKVRGIRTVDGKTVKTSFSKVISRVAK